MKHRWSVLSLMLLLALLPLILASANGSFDLSWWTVDSGGGQSGGGGFNLQGVAGQPDPGLLQGSDFRLAGGFLSGGTALPPPGSDLFLPLLVKP